MERVIYILENCDLNSVGITEFTEDQFYEIADKVSDAITMQMDSLVTQAALDLGIETG